MSEPRVAYEKDLGFTTLHNEIAYLERRIHHDIDNYGVDMQEEIKEALKGLEKACRTVKKQMEAVK